MSTVPTPAPESLPPRLARAAVVVAVVASAANAIGTAFSPYLLVERPLLLVGLSADVRHLVLAGGQVDFGLLLGVGTLRRILSMVSTYALAAAYGPAAIGWVEGRWPRLAGVVRWVSRALDKGGAALLLAVPTYSLAALAGAARFPFRTFLWTAILGQLWLVAVYLLVGEALMGFTAPLLAWLKTHVVPATAVSVVLVGLQQGVSRLRARRRKAKGEGGRHLV